jgi:predicted nucleic acid-binding protein
MTTLVVDTNIIFSALVNKNSNITSYLLQPNHLLIMPKFAFVELFKHKEKICTISKYTQEEILELLYQLLRQIEFFDENVLSKDALQTAWQLVKDIDPKDMLFVALTLEVNGLLWTGDTKLRNGLKAKGFDAFFRLN